MLVTGTVSGKTWISSITTGWESVRTALITLPLTKERGEKKILSIDFFFFLGAQCNPGCEELCYLCQYEEDVCFRAS